MRVSNKLIEKSFQYTPEKENLLVRSDEIGDFDDVVNYCRELKEKISYDNSFWEVEVEPGISLSDWLFSRSGSGKEDDRRRIMSFINDTNSTEGNLEEECIQIAISLGKMDEAASTEKEYVQARRAILSTISNAAEYEQFMRSCFRKSTFADGILSEMKYIKDFSLHAKEITENLAVLNDEAVDLYQKYSMNLQTAIDILDKKLLACSLDPHHKNELKFKFTYYEILNGEEEAKVKEICCSPHLKLIRQDSDLRIYFYWCDEKVGAGEKVLVGRIGRHPY
jgi:hypothetical protein